MLKAHPFSRNRTVQTAQSILEVIVRRVVEHPFARGILVGQGLDRTELQLHGLEFINAVRGTINPRIQFGNIADRNCRRDQNIRTGGTWKRRKANPRGFRDHSDLSCRGRDLDVHQGANGNRLSDQRLDDVISQNLPECIARCDPNAAVYYLQFSDGRRRPKHNPTV